MVTVFGLDNVSGGWNESTVCVGVFDGVHLGHREVVSTAVRNARTNSRPCIVLTFDKHPMMVTHPKNCPETILSQGLKLAKIAEAGADLTVVAVFDKGFASQSPDGFTEDVLIAHLKAASVVVGHDFGFGKDRSGTVELLASKINTIVVGPVEVDGERVSSSKIREHIKNGRMETASMLLGSPFAIEGLVVPGAKRGRRLGVPTINIEPVQTQIMPKNGIYAGSAKTPIGIFTAAVSVGERPTISGAGFAIEAYLLDYPGDELYGQNVVLSFVQRLRDEMRFDTEEALVCKMTEDVENVRRIMEACVA